jgi:SAM-dependent methyltransferase
MSIGYSLLYAVGYTPWELIAELPRVNQQFSVLLDREERDRRPPFESALDLGCGSGIWTVALAQRGWQVTGVDNVRKALRRARQRAHTANVEPRFVRADVTRPFTRHVGTGYRLLLDFGLFHDELTDSQRAAMGRHVSAVAAPNATLLMMAWAPKNRRLLPRGAGPADVQAAYPSWIIVDEHPFDVSDIPFYKRITDADPRFYRLTNTPPPSPHLSRGTT